MSLFEYISVMVSVVLALGIAQILTGIGAFLSARDRHRAYWLHSVWLTFLALLHVYMWWYFWDLRSNPPDTSPAFIFTLLGPALIYLPTYVLLEGRFPSNAKEHFDRVRRPFFALIIAGTTYQILNQLLNPWVLGYSVPVVFKVGTVLQVGAATAGFFTSDRRVHGAIALYFLMAMVWALTVRFELDALAPK
ncbi:MAG: hypothetical protein OEM05_10730 [Myxococcales bacterium]|nr:hypothetical protein [Myxococcales bacterium]